MYSPDYHSCSHVSAVGNYGLTVNKAQHWGEEGGRYQITRSVVKIDVFKNAKKYKKIKKAPTRMRSVTDHPDPPCVK